MDEIGKVGRILGTPGDDRISGPIFGHRLADDSTTFVDFIFGQGGKDTLKGGGDRECKRNATICPLLFTGRMPSCAKSAGCHVFTGCMPGCSRKLGSHLGRY